MNVMGLERGSLLELNIACKIDTGGVRIYVMEEMAFYWIQFQTVLSRENCISSAFMYWITLALLVGLSCSLIQPFMLIITTTMEEHVS